MMSIWRSASLTGRILGAAALAPLLAAPVYAGSQTPTSPDIRAVIELYTSQGCSYCPPADKLLESYAAQPDILTLSMPVDYWDYTGWKDTFALPKNKDRQRSYAKARGDGAIYTPQAVVNGSMHVNGADKTAIDAALAATEVTLADQRVAVKFWQERNTLFIETGVAKPNSEVKEATIWLGVVQSKGEADIKAGENAGHKLAYINIIRELTPIGLWRGDAVKIQIPRQAVMLPEVQKAIVLIQQGKAGPIIGAASTGLF